MLLLARRAREELHAAGARPRRSALTGPDALTPAEHRVAELAALGHGNRAIAERLYVTQRTVETHLTHAFQKLNISSRAELAAALEPQAGATALRSLTVDIGARAQLSAPSPGAGLRPEVLELPERFPRSTCHRCQRIVIDGDLEPGFSSQEMVEAR